MEDADIEDLYKFVKDKSLEGAAATFSAENPFGYGRIVRAGKGFKIVEEKEANEEEQKITEVNSGFYIIKTEYILKHIDTLSSNNNTGEFYLTDLFSQEELVQPFLVEEASKFIGVNDLRQLEMADRTIRNRKMRRMRDEGGVRFIDLSHTYIEEDVSIENGALIYPNSFISGKTTIKSGAVIETGSVIKDSVIEEGVKIKAYSHLEKVVVRTNAEVGPFARLREGSDIGSESKIGNFVETKKAILSKGVKVSHLSYVGDAEVGEDSNLGCGFITCNYDGANKHKTKIGKGCFIGSDSQMIAPLNIGDGCYVASGSTISKDLPDGAFGIGRARQEIKEGMAKRFIKKK
jgi:bifunctional UDP-N-acetylglucosamine pyrophosphorylase/glucosamine-1-phosphate N-acetyltransferase